MIHKSMEKWGAAEWCLFIIGLAEITYFLCRIVDKLFAGVQ